jgi:hypothetical protein
MREAREILKYAEIDYNKASRATPMASFTNRFAIFCDQDCLLTRNPRR